MSALKLYYKPRQKRIGPEAQLQMAVIQYLKLAGVPGLLYFSVANEQKCSVQRGAMLKRMGRLAGVSDLVILIPKEAESDFTVLFLELKSATGDQTKAQDAFQRAVQEFNGQAYYQIADNIDQAIRILCEHGAIKPVSRRQSPLSRAA